MNTKSNFGRRRPLAGARQRGVSLIFALLAMVSLTLAAIALVRAVDTGALVIGNLGFKQSTTATADQAAEAAIAFLTAPGGVSLDSDAPDKGYYATSYDALDPTNRRADTTTRAVVDWAGDNCGTDSYDSGTFSGGCLTPAASVSANGNTTQYIITRLCTAALAPANSGNVCSGPLSSTTGTSPTKGLIDYQNSPFGQTGVGPYYRIVVRVVGARNTTTFVETIVHF